MTKEEQEAELLNNRIEKIEYCVHILEATANNYYSPSDKGLKGWNTLLGSRDNIKKLLNDDYKRLEKVKSIIESK